MRRAGGWGLRVVFVVGFFLAAGSSASADEGGSGGDLDVMFIGAHPDDEASGLATYGQWNEYEGVETGVVTITRGEGGGNAVGPEEGAELGLLREDEERRAVGRAGIENIYNLDEVDFYYTVSSPLTEEIWGHDETLEKVVRVLRHTRPEVIVTMDPAPTPGNHGHHQYAGRIAIEAFHAAANPDAFPEQISEEGLETWRPARIFQNSAAGEVLAGEDCASEFEVEEPTDNVFGVWGGRESERNDGKLWAQVEREAQQIYESQGWAVFPDIPDDPAQAECDYFTQIESRVPFSADDASPTAMLEGALEPAEGGLPLGTEFYLTTDAFDVVAGEPFAVTAHATSGEGNLPDAEISLDLPEGWEAEGDGNLGTVSEDRESSANFEVTPPPDAPAGERHRIGATLESGEMSGGTNRVVEVAPAVTGVPDPLPQVEQFREWAMEAGVPQIADLVPPVLPIGAGKSRQVRINLSNSSGETRSGTVELSLPDGFSAEPEAREYEGLAPGASGSVTFDVTNDGDSLATGMQGGEEGDYPFEIETTSEGGGESSQEAAFNLVPTTAIEESPEAPEVDGAESEGEYGDESLDIGKLWEGEEPDSAEDASGVAKVAWADDALYFLVEVADEEFGSVLTPEDAKRHWRTDSVEIAIDPRGDSENTSSTFKVGLFPKTDDPENDDAAFAYRDADAHQGVASETAPGMEIEASVSEPYEGYVIEAMVPLEDLPASVDPEDMGLNVFIYDSDTQDKTGQTRLGWSTWGGVQGDPYRWGNATLDGYEPSEDASSEPPVIPTEATKSEASPQTIAQSAVDGVPLSGAPAAEDGAVELSAPPSLSGESVSLELTAREGGEANVFVWDGERAMGEEALDLEAGESADVNLPVENPDEAMENGAVLIGFRNESGETASITHPLGLMETGGDPALLPGLSMNPGGPHKAF